ncbi:hypothetical protein Tco_0094465, partial [Tanacetum coccineum]
GLDVADTLCFQLGGVRRRMTWRQFIMALGLHTEQEMAEAGFGAYWADSDRGRKSGAKLSGGHFVRRLAVHFGLVSDEGLRGLSVVTREHPLIDLHELGRLNICSRYGDTWALVAPGPEWQQAAVAGAYKADKGGPTVDEDDQDVPAPVQAPQPPLPTPQPQTIFTTEQSRVSTWLISCMTQLMNASGHTYQAFDSTFVGSSRMPYQRRIRPRTGDASTSAAPHTDDQPDP